MLTELNMTKFLEMKGEERNFGKKQVPDIFIVISILIEVWPSSGCSGEGVGCPGGDAAVS